MVCSESDEESTRNSNDVSISLCAYLSKYRVQTNNIVVLTRASTLQPLACHVGLVDMEDII